MYFFFGLNLIFDICVLAQIDLNFGMKIGPMPSIDGTDVKIITKKMKICWNGNYIEIKSNMGGM